MRRNSADRAFVGIVVLGALPFALVGFVFCGVTGAVALRLLARPSDVIKLLPGLVVAIVLGLGLIAGARSLVRQWRATRGLASYVQAHRVDTPSRVGRLSERIHRDVSVIADDAPFSFAYGAGRPSIVISQGLVDRCSDNELEAVLEHERYHVTARDPLKVMVTRSLSSAAFFLPALNNLNSRYLVGRELAADRRAVHHCGSKPLAGALYRTVGGAPDMGLSAAAALGGSEALDVRLTQLETGHEPRLPSPSRRELVYTTIALIALTVCLALTWAVLDGLHAYDMSGRPASTSSAWSVLGGLACAAPWIVGGFFWVRRRRRRQLAGH